MNNNITATTNSDGVLVIPAGSLPSGGSSIEDESVVIKGTVSASSNSTKSLTITNSLIKADNINLPLTYGNTSTSTSGNITLTNSYMLWTGLTGNKFIKLSSILGSTIIAKKAPTASENDRVYLMTQPGGSITSHRDKPSVIEGVFCHELLGQPGIYSNTKYIDCGSNILNNTGGRIDIRGISFAPGSLRGSDGDSYEAV